MKFDMVMPKMGESISEGTIIKWLKKVGDTVEKDEIILEISTDKVDSEIPTPVAGKIAELNSNEGDTVEVGTVIARIETEESVEQNKPAEPKEKLEESPVEPKSETAQTQPVAAVQEKPAPVSNRFYSPVVLGIVRTEGISMEELEAIPGTGINGRVSKKDVLAYLEDRKTGQPASQASAPTSTAAPATKITSGENVTIEPMGHIRKKIAEHMVHTVHTSPHVALFTEVDMSNVVKIREKNKNSFYQREGVKLTYLPFISEAVIRTLKEFPYVNASIDNENVLIKNYINLGIAVATEQGLIVPVIKNADNLNVAGISKAINDLATRARNKKLMPDEVSGGTFSISNFGVYGTTIGFPLINQPQLAILGVGALQKRAVVINDAIAIRPMMNISITFDHRLIDGEMGAKFLQRVSLLLSEYDINTVL
jgi:2-oxoglutarate dehydrogenase E2 component (dihydrolipoamide succinyltransferase)